LKDRQEDTVSYELFIAAFENDEDRAGKTLERIKKLKKEGALYFENAAVIVKPKEGDVEVKDIGDVDSKRGAIFGAITGALVGSLGGPVGAIAGAVAGAATGGATARLADYGVSDKLIKETEERLQPGSSAVIALVQLKWADKAVAQLEKNGATVIRETLEFEGIGGYSHGNLA
jgi:uncharacterized membrane protein